MMVINRDSQQLAPRPTVDHQRPSPPLGLRRTGEREPAQTGKEKGSKGRDDSRFPLPFPLFFSTSAQSFALLCAPIFLDHFSGPRCEVLFCFLEVRLFRLIHSLYGIIKKIICSSQAVVP